MDILNRVIEFTTEGLMHEDYATIAFDSGMQARVVQYSETSNGLATVRLDMTEFLKHNVNYMKPNWENRAGQQVLKWNQTKFYPKGHQVDVVFWKEQPPFILR